VEYAGYIPLFLEEKQSQLILLPNLLCWYRWRVSLYNAM